MFMTHLPPYAATRFILFYPQHQESPWRTGNLGGEPKVPCLAISQAMWVDTRG